MKTSVTFSRWITLSAGLTPIASVATWSADIPCYVNNWWQSVCAQCNPNVTRYCGQTWCPDSSSQGYRVWRTHEAWEDESGHRQATASAVGTCEFIRMKCVGTSCEVDWIDTMTCYDNFEDPQSMPCYNWGED